MENVIATLIADLLGLPEWAPRALRRTVGIALLITGVFFTPLLMRIIEIWAHREASEYLKMIAPLLRPSHAVGGVARH